MYCTSCGFNIPDGDKFCQNCGAAVCPAPVVPTPPAEAIPAASSSAFDTAPATPAAPAQSGKKSGGLTILIIAAVIVALIGFSGKDKNDYSPAHQENGYYGDVSRPADEPDDGAGGSSGNMPSVSPAPDDEYYEDEYYEDSRADEPAEEAPAYISPLLPDPTSFFGGVAPQTDEPANISGRYYYYRLEIDAGYSAALEYTDLLSEWGFVLTDNSSETIMYLLDEKYYFDYVGGDDVTPASAHFFNSGDADFCNDVFVWIQKDGRSEYTGIGIYFSEDFILQDVGARASALPDYTAGSSSGSSGGAGTPNQSKLPCLNCDGDGDCPECNGYGTVDVYMGAGDSTETICPLCHGRRKCKVCHGSGTR